MSTAETVSLEALKFPIGLSPRVESFDAAQVAAQIERIAALPANFRDMAMAVKRAQSWMRVYRPGGWSALEVAHHVPDSHMHAYARFKFSLTEDNPEIKPYAEEKWVLQPDATLEGVEEALAMVDAIHARWVRLMRGMKPSDWMRGYFHPGYGKTYTLFQAVALYAWHGEHHLAHLKMSLSEK
jgi:DinB superfamily